VQKSARNESRSRRLRAGADKPAQQSGRLLFEASTITGDTTRRNNGDTPRKVSRSSTGTRRDGNSRRSPSSDRGTHSSGRDAVVIRRRAVVAVGAARNSSANDGAGERSRAPAPTPARHGNGERFGGLEIDNEGKFARLLDREIAGLHAMQNFPGRSAPKRPCTAWALANSGLMSPVGPELAPYERHTPVGLITRG
jgi:hypothetical protein